MSKIQSKYNLAHRPDSYWEHSDPLQAILSGISGTARREMITDYWNAGRFDELEEGLLQDELDTRTRESLGAFHPFFMGGEYLPPRYPGEEVIVTIQLQSTTFDVIELRGRPLPGGKIALRWVDEYETEFPTPSEEIEQPMSFEELIGFIEGSGPEELGGFPLAYNQMNYDCIPDAGNLRNFTSFSSDYYPELYDWAEEQFENWVREMDGKEILEEEA